MNFDDQGNLLTPNGAKLDNALCNDFDSYCFTATMLMEKGLHVEFRRALSKASALVEQILRAEHPRTLACFLEVFIHLIQTGFPKVTSSLCDYIKRMSAKVILGVDSLRSFCLHLLPLSIYHCSTFHKHQLINSVHDIFDPLPSLQAPRTRIEFPNPRSSVKSHSAIRAISPEPTATSIA